LQKVWNAKRRAERVAFGGTAEVIGEDALPDETDDAADENAGADEERRSTSAGRRRFWFCGRLRNRCADLFDSFSGDRAGRLIGGDFGVARQRAYSFILFRSVL
jgi:hypothetical protein